MTTDPLLNFMEKLDKMNKNEEGKNLKNFVDCELTMLYKDLLMLEGESIPKINLTLDKLNNNILRKSLKLNYYFDHIYVLNLDRRPDRLKNMVVSLNKLGIYNWSKFSAIDGKKEPHYSEWCNYKKQRMTQTEKMKYQRKAIASAGSWAILKSMFLMLRDAIEKKWETILVFQDDLLFHKNFVDEFLSIPDKIPKNWKLLYLGATQHNWEYVEYRTKYYFPFSCDGAFAVAIHSSIFKELMNEIIKFDMPFDSGALKTIQKRYGRQCIVLSPNLAIADIRDSDLRNSRDLLNYSKKFRWNLNLYDYT